MDRDGGPASVLGDTPECFQKAGADLSGSPVGPVSSTPAFPES
jgi:hypothetical protein